MEIERALNKQRHELTGKANGKVTDMERQLTEVQAAAAEKAAAEEAKARQERIELMRRSAVRRILARELSLGWSAWMEMWEARTYAIQQLRRCGNKLRAPSLNAAFALWVAAYIEEKHRAAYEASLRENTSLEGALRVAQYEKGQLTLVMAAREDEILGLKQRVTELTAEVQQNSAAISAAAEAKRALGELKELYHETQEEQVEAERRVARSESEADIERRGFEELLNKLLGEQRRSFEAETAELRARLAARTEAEQREARIEVLRKMAMRRMMYAALSRGWEAWVDHCEAAINAKGLLKQLGSRLQVKGVGGAFTLWARVVTQQKIAMLNMSSDQRVALAEKEVANLDREVAQLQADINEVTSQRDRLQAKVLELSGGAEDVQALLQEQSEAERRRRIEMFGRQTLRRMINNDLRRGWTAWQSLYDSKRDAQHLLQRSARRLRTAMVSVAFEDWFAAATATASSRQIQDLQTRTKALEAELEQARDRVEGAKADLEAAVASIESQKAEALERQRVELAGTLEEREALFEQQAKESRVEQMRRQAGRRLVFAGLADGWNAWVEGWDAKRQALQRLQEAGSRLRAPEKAHAFGIWADLLVEKHERLQREQLTGMQKREHDLEVKCAKLEREIEFLQKNYDLMLAKAEEEKDIAVQRMVTELTGQAAEVEAVKEAQAKEARVEQLRTKMVKRLLNRGLALSFETWAEVCASKRYATERLQKCSNRLRTPEKAAAWNFWVADFERATRQAAWQELVVQSKSVEAQLRQARYENKQMEMVKVAQDDEIRALQEQVRVLSGQQTDSIAKLATMGHLPEDLERLKEIAATAEATAKEAVEKREAAEQDVMRQLDANKQLLERLLEEQRQKLGVASHDVKEQLDKQTSLRAENDAALARLKVRQPSPFMLLRLSCAGLDSRGGGGAPVRSRVSDLEPDLHR